MRLFMVPSFYEADDTSYGGMFLRDQAQALAGSGLDVVVAYPDLRTRVGVMRRGIYRDYLQQIPTYIDRRRIFSPLAPRSFTPKRIAMLEALYERTCRDVGEPDIVHLFSCDMGVEAVALCQKYNLPLVYTENSVEILERMDDGLNALFAYTLECCDSPVAVSEDMKARMVAKRPDTLVIPGLVDTDAFKILPSVEMPGAFVFAANSSHTPQSGLDILIRAFTEALRHMPGAKLLVGGTGAQEPTLKALIAELKAENSVELVGPVTRSIAPKFYNGCDCFISPCYTEYFGMSVLEALTCGKPVITTRSGGPENYINKKNGILVNAGDLLSLERALVFMYRRAKSYNPFELREQCIHHFGKSYVCQRLVQLYAHILDKKRRNTAR